MVERIVRNILNSAPKIISHEDEHGRTPPRHGSCSDLDDDDVLEAAAAPAVEEESYIYGIYIYIVVDRDG